MGLKFDGAGQGKEKAMEFGGCGIINGLNSDGRAQHLKINNK